MPNTAKEPGDDDRSAPACEPIHSGPVGGNDSDGQKPRTPWYREGLKFTCTQCGDCCSGSPGAVWVTDDELTAIAEELGRPVGEVRLLHTKLIAGRWSLRDYPNGDCVFLDPQTRRCSVYSSRPAQCRTWPFWKINLESLATWERTCDACPGSGTGQLYSIEEIESQMTESPI